MVQREERITPLAPTTGFQGKISSLFIYPSIPRVSTHAHSNYPFTNVSLAGTLSANLSLPFE